LLGYASSGELERLINQLHDNGRLTPTIILRALCVGDMDFFETALSKGSEIAVSNVHLLVNDASGQGLKQLCKKCKIPQGVAEMMRVAVDVVNELEYDGDPGDRERFRNHVIQRVLTHFEDRFDAENVDYLISKIAEHDSNSTEAA
jgi:uncharacterized protein (DUF2336 family)